MAKKGTPVATFFRAWFSADGTEHRKWYAVREDGEVVTKDAVRHDDDKWLDWGWKCTPTQKRTPVAQVEYATKLLTPQGFKRI